MPSNGGNIGTNDWILNRIGGGGGCCGNWVGDIAEIILYDRALSEDEESAVGAYLASKYGITTTYVAPGPIIPFQFTKVELDDDRNVIPNLQLDDRLVLLVRRLERFRELGRGERWRPRGWSHRHLNHHHL